MFATTAPSDWFENGAYTVTLAAQTSVPGLRVQSTTGQFEMVALPALTMVVTPTETIQPGQPVRVIVTVENWRPEYVPRLQIYGSGAMRVVTPTWSTQETGVFTGTIITPFGVRSSFAVAAQLVGELFDTIQTTPQLVEYTTIAPPPIVVTTQYPTWLLIPLCGVHICLGALS